MKRLFLIVMAALMALAAISCKKEEKKEELQLNERDLELQEEFNAMMENYNTAPEGNHIRVLSYGDKYFSRDDNRFGLKFSFVNVPSGNAANGIFNIPCEDVAPEERGLENYYYKWEAHTYSDGIIFHFNYGGSEVSLKQAIFHYDTVNLSGTYPQIDIIAEGEDGKYYYINWLVETPGEYPAELKKPSANFTFQQNRTRMSAVYRHLPLSYRNFDVLCVTLETGETDPIVTLNFNLIAKPANSAIDAINTTIDRSYFYGTGDSDDLADHKIFAYYRSYSSHLVENEDDAGVLRGVNRWGETVYLGYVYPSTSDKVQIGYPTNKSYIDISGQLDLYLAKSFKDKVDASQGKFKVTISSPKMDPNDIKEEGFDLSL